MNRKVAFYISGHGFGHCTRTMAVINQIADEFGVIVKTSAPKWLFDQNVKRQFDFHCFQGDVGAIQPNCLQLHREITLRTFAQLTGNQKEQIDSEARFLESENVVAVAFDIPSVAAEIAEKAGIPSIGFSNFSWDEIYEPYVEEFTDYQYLIELLREQYRKTSVLLKLPFHLPMAVFPNQENWPLLARVSNADPEKIKRKLGVPEDRTVVLLSFGGIPLEGLKNLNLEDMKDFFFLSFFKEPVSDADNYRNIGKNELPHEDVLKAADIVISKPGYGIVSECIANGTAMIYAERQDFIEYPELVKGIEKHLAHSYIPAESLFSGQWKPYLETFGSCENKWQGIEPVEIDDGTFIANRIMSI